jgi:hypothetical protein
VTAPDSALVVRRAAEWAFRNRRTGGITVAQWPNIPLAVFLAVTVALRLAHPAGSIGSAGRIIAGVALAVWALDEVIRGVNPFRRLLGAVVLGALIAGLALR